MFWISVLEASIRLSVPLLLVALGELISERSGVINIGLEGMMSAGAYIGFVVMAASGIAHIALPAAALAGMAVAAVMAGDKISCPNRHITLPLSAASTYRLSLWIKRRTSSHQLTPLT